MGTGRRRIRGRWNKRATVARPLARDGGW